MQQSTNDPKSLINWNEVDLIFFDMDGTLLDLHFDSHFWLDLVPKLYSEKNNLTIEESRQYVNETIMAERGTLQWYSLEYWSAIFDLDIINAQEIIKEKIRFRDHALMFVDQLQTLGYPLWLTTNADTHSLGIKKKTLEFTHYFEHIISSHDIGFPKESQNFWKNLMEQYPFDPSRVLFFDDTLSVLISAQEFGVNQTIFMRQPDSQQPPKAMANSHTSIVDFDEIIIEPRTEPA